MFMGQNQPEESIFYEGGTYMVYTFKYKCTRRAETKQLVERMTAQPHNGFVFCVVVAEFAINGNQAL